MGGRYHLCQWYFGLQTRLVDGRQSLRATRGTLSGYYWQSVPQSGSLPGPCQLPEHCVDSAVMVLTILWHHVQCKMVGRAIQNEESAGDSNVVRMVLPNYMNSCDTYTWKIIHLPHFLQHKFGSTRRRASKGRSDSIHLWRTYKSCCKTNFSAEGHKQQHGLLVGGP